MLKNIVRAVVLVGLVVLAVGCFPPPPVQTTVQPSTVVYQQPAPVATTAYTPQYYNGYVVYFDTSGFPFYYLNGAPTYVPDSCTCYEGLVSYYRTYSTGYAQWYAAEGTRLLNIGLHLGL
jgi:hypothetical protein